MHLMKTKTEDKASNRMHDRDRKHLLKVLSELQVENQLLCYKEELLCDCFDHVPIGILIADIEGNIVYCNKFFREVTRIKKGKATGNSIRNIKKNISPEINFDDILLKGDNTPLIFDKTTATKHGKMRLHFEAQRFNLLNTSPAVLITCQDVTPYEADRLEIERERDTLAAIIRESDAGVVITDREGKIITINGKGVEILECGSGSVIGEPFGEIFSIYNVQSGRSYTRLIEQVLASGDALIFPEETMLRTFTGTKKFISGKGFTIADDRREYSRIAFIMRDISEAREAEQMLSNVSHFIMPIVNSSVPVF